MSAIRRVAVLAALVGGIVVAAASPAVAHAILLRTEPSPQTTVTDPPTAVRLYFSEPVEVAFGAVRVYDVDGHRVDPGTLRRAGGDREVLASLGRLRDGTYTVTWRVTSADGHPVHGGFQFYVGAPSTISPVAIAGEQGTGRLVGWGYDVVRFAWFAGLLGLVGMVVARRWVWTPSVRATGDGASVATDGFRRRFAVALPGCLALLGAAGVLALVFQSATVSGLSLLRAARPGVLREVIGTTFGQLWVAEMALTAALVVPVVALVRRRPLVGLRPPLWIGVLGVLAVGLCVVAGLNGHARTGSHPSVEVAAVAAHLLAVAVWVGGLGALVALGAPGWRTVPEASRGRLLREVVARFGRVASVAVAVVIVSGVVTAAANSSGVGDLWRTAYGRVIGAKVVLLGGALVLAARHRQVTPKRLAEAGGAVAAVRDFDRSSVAELVLLAATVALAAGLVVLVPGRSLALAARGPVNAARRAGAYTVQLLVDPTAVGSNQVHVTFVNAQGLGAAEVTTVTVAAGPEGGALRPIAMRLIAPGHFVGDATLPRPGRYRVSVTGPASAGTTFTFRVRGGALAAR